MCNYVLTTTKTRKETFGNEKHKCVAQNEHRSTTAAYHRRPLRYKQNGCCSLNALQFKMENLQVHAVDPF